MIGEQIGLVLRPTLQPWSASKPWVKLTLQIYYSLPQTLKLLDVGTSCQQLCITFRAAFPTFKSSGVQSRLQYIHSTPIVLNRAKVAKRAIPACFETGWPASKWGGGCESGCSIYTHGSHRHYKHFQLHVLPCCSFHSTYTCARQGCTRQEWRELTISHGINSHMKLISIPPYNYKYLNLEQFL